jgi:tetratricopeptide (TPR) repeat protein
MRKIQVLFSNIKIRHEIFKAAFLVTIFISLFYFIISSPVYGETSSCEKIYKKNEYQCLLKKANNGNIDAQYELGVLYLYDNKYSEALKWLKKASDAGNASASMELADYYSASRLYEGKLVPVNYQESLRFYKIAAEAGNKDAALELGMAYDKGLKGVKKDYGESIKWLHLAVKNGSPDTKILLDKVIFKDEIYKTLFVKPIEKLKDISFIEYIIALFLALIGILLTIKFNREKLPFYSLEGFNLIRDLSNALDSLEVLYKKNKINSLTVTHIAFWNAGRETINRADIVSRDPLRLIFKETGEFIEAVIAFQNNESNNFQYEISEDKSIVYITFDYIDKNDGLILQVLHTNISPYNVDLTGKIKGAAMPKKKVVSTDTSSTKNFIFSILPALLLIVTFISFCLFTLFNDIDIIFLLFKNKIMLLLIFAFCILFPLFVIITRSISYFKNRLPKGYKNFLEGYLN